MATNVYYSVGQNSTDHKTGSPTITIASGVATFSVAQTATNMGVGDRVTYNTTSICYLVAKTSTTVWSVVTALGVAPADVSGQTVNSIAHEYTSLSAAEAGAPDADHINNTSLVAADVALNIPCYYDSAADTTYCVISGWTVGETNWIKVYTPYNTSTECNQSQRHNGAWSNTAYSMAPTTQVHTLTLSQDFIRVDGLQVSTTTYNAEYLNGIYINDAGKPVACRISNNIVKEGNASSGRRYGIYISSEVYAALPHYIWNNIVYGFSASGINNGVSSATLKCYVYNNTIANCAVSGIASTYRTTLSYNSIIYGCPDAVDGDALDPSSDYNSTDINETSTPWGTHSRKNQTFSFVNAAGNDFRLLKTDVGARTYGTDLSGDLNLPFSTDIANNNRKVQWDIGAYQTPKTVYYSVGQNTTDHKTGSPNVVIASGVATFDVAQTATNLGAGDRLTAGGNVYYLYSKVSTTVWNVVTKLGVIPADLASTAVTSIAHEYTSFSAAEAGAPDANHLNTSDLATNNFILVITCYYDSGEDTNVTDINGWTTDSTRYFVLYVPYLSTECNQSQRHGGAWSSSAYVLSYNSTPYVLLNAAEFTVIDGIQLASRNGSQYGAFGIQDANSSTVRNCIIKAEMTNIISISYGIAYYGTTNASYYYNNIIYGWISSGNRACGIFSSTYGSSYLYIYNNTVYGCGGAGDVRGGNILIGATITVARNNLMQAPAYGTNDFYSTGGAALTSSNNITSDASSPDTAYRSKTVTFSSQQSVDYRLSPKDCNAKNKGYDLSTLFTTDIQNRKRPIGNSWDIGASEAKARVRITSVSH